MAIVPGQLMKGPEGKAIVTAALGQHYARAKELEAALRRYPEGSAEAKTLQERLEEITNDARGLLEIHQAL